MEHNDRLHELEVAVTGNGGTLDERKNSLMWKVDLLIERQKPLFDFVKGWKNVFWICLPVCVCGAFAAIWAFLKIAVEHGKL